MPNPFVALGTDGYGRSDSREALRNFFEVDRFHIVISAIKSLVDNKKIEKTILINALKKFKINGQKPNPVNI